MSTAVLALPGRKFFFSETELVRYQFDAGSPVHDGDYYVRGGICWPQMTEGGVLGCALICARDMKTDMVAVLAEHEFSVIDPVVRGDGGIEDFPYLAQFLSDGWSGYFCDTYYRHEAPASHHLYLTQVLASPMVNPKPSFPKVDWADELDALTRIYALDEARRLKYKAGGPLHQAMQARTAATMADPKSNEYAPALLALMAAVIGIQRRPNYLAERRG